MTKDNILNDLISEQKAGTLKECPRCGLRRMKNPITTNALSRRADIYVCDLCGTKEAVADFLHEADGTEKWYTVASRYESYVRKSNQSDE